MLSSLLFTGASTLYWVALVAAIWVSASVLAGVLWILACLFFQRRASRAQLRADAQAFGRGVDWLLGGDTDRETAR